MKIYLASSWKNAEKVKNITGILRNFGHEVDAFCDSSTGRFVFNFGQLPDVTSHNAMTILAEESVQRAFAEDKKWIDWADCVLLVRPAGKSAHLEAGYAKGAGKLLIIYEEQFENGDFDVMYGFADLVTDNFAWVVRMLEEHDAMRERTDN
ncbi:hypothetical protein [Tumebacillus flagellatus]|uniref:Nucleoside 2-deoxyribosyltransferase n=1 Tax=Tumebacillus flagellatus TaxID=1157490 RepID=A0A074MGE4_9BACL|nr:hypothetical protein [Tumebacillus flagellatus]KEO84782.1 hypothetical protein EL26_01865 [Tumebacillus flagellatus]